MALITNDEFTPLTREQITSIIQIINGFCGDERYLNMPSRKTLLDAHELIRFLFGGLEGMQEAWKDIDREGK